MAVLSTKTLQEMEAGALALAHHRGEDALPEGYMDAMIRTQERHELLKAWEREGKITTELVIEPMKPDKLDNGQSMYVGQTRVMYHLIHCGSQTFDDRMAESRGAFPSEVLIANIALAIGAGVHKGDR